MTAQLMIEHFCVRSVSKKVIMIATGSECSPATTIGRLCSVAVVTQNL